VLDGATQDGQSVTSSWTVLREPIDGVLLHEVRNVLKDNGWITELYRGDWALDAGPVDQVFQVTLEPGGVSAWHCHRHTTDRLFVTSGTVKVVLYDHREDSPTRGTISVYRLGERRPGLLLVPPEVWHGVQNVGSEKASMVNLVDRAYAYESPDHWRVPSDHPGIPYSWA
jgi:dTDP-4-dehydrorhamnose 3,5-epimerase